MNDKLSRRDLIRAGAAAGLTAALPKTAFGEAPAVAASKGVRPVVISSANGNKFKNGGDVTCVQKAFTMITQGLDVLDALIAGVNLVELDPTDDSVGYGGLPNAEGVVQLDSCCMHGPSVVRHRGVSLTRAWRARVTFSRISLADLVQMKGFGSALC